TEKVDATTYRLSWTVPDGAQSYRIKCSEKTIVEWLDFDPASNQFAVDPAANIPWFAAAEIAEVPAPLAAGRAQTFEVHNLDSKKQWHFAIKTYVQHNR